MADRSPRPRSGQGRPGPAAPGARRVPGADRQRSGGAPVPERDDRPGAAEPAVQQAAPGKRAAAAAAHQRSADHGPGVQRGRDVDILPVLKGRGFQQRPSRAALLVHGRSALARVVPPAWSRRDVDCCVEVRVAGEAAGGTDETGLALARFLVDPPAGTAPQAGVRGRMSCTRPGALFSVRSRSRPQPWARMARLRPAFCATFRPGFSVVPRAEAVMLTMLSFSNRIVSYSVASMVLVFSHQSLRRPASRALIRAAAAYSAAFCGLSLGARAARRWCLRSRARSRLVSWGQLRLRPSDRAAVMTTPRSMPIASPVPGPGSGSGLTANATCHCPLR